MSPAVGFQDATAIAGIAQTAFSKHLEPTEAELACQVIVDACADAGIDPSEIDALCSYTMEATEEVDIARNIGCGEITFFSQVGYGGGAGLRGGGPRRAGRGHRSGRGGRGVAVPQAGLGAPTLDEHVGPAAGARARGRGRSGCCGPVDEIAMLTRRYMHEYGATRDHLANVAMAVRKHANMNPAAIMYDKPMSREDYMASRWVSEPLCLFDNCLETDGALACVIVSAERARDLRHPPVYVHAFAQGLPPQHQTMVNFFNDDPLTGPAWACARRLWANADFGPEDVDVAQIYDAFSPLILLSLEGYGFCKRGEAGRLHREREPRVGEGLAAGQHLRRRAVRGLRARLQPHQRRGEADAGHLDGPGGGGRDLPGDLGRGRAHERPAPAALTSTARGETEEP